MRYGQCLRPPGPAVPALSQRARSAAGRSAPVAATGSAHALRPGLLRAGAAAVALAAVTRPADDRQCPARGAVEAAVALRLLATTHVPAARGWTQVRARSILPSDPGPRLRPGSGASRLTKRPWSRLLGSRPGPFTNGLRLPSSPSSPGRTRATSIAVHGDNQSQPDPASGATRSARTPTARRRTPRSTELGTDPSGDESPIATETRRR